MQFIDILFQYVSVQKSIQLRFIGQITVSEASIEWPIYKIYANNARLYNKNNINGFVLKNGLISEFNEISYDEYKVFEQKKGIKLINEILYYKDRYTVDIAISRAFWEVNKADDRILYVNARIFEDETYQRLRYEFSKYIINHKQELKYF